MNNDQEPSLSIIIPVFNGEATLGEQIEAVLAAMDATMELLVVDNRSTDGTRNLALSFVERDDRVRVVDASERQGEPHARNVGVAAAGSDLIAFCDADDVVSHTWPTAMREALRTASFVTGPVELDRLNPPWLAGMRGRRLFATIPTTVNGIPFAHGCNFGIQRSVAVQVGGWNEAEHVGCDLLFSLRAHQLGIEVGWVDSAVVHYRHRASARQRWRQAMAFGRTIEHVHAVAGSSYPLRQRVRAQTRRFGWLVKTAPKLYDRAHRAKWWWTAATAIGEIRGDRA